MKKTIKDFDLEGKKVIIRCDLNVPMVDNIIEDDTRIKASLRTIKYAINNNAKVILLSHLGKVKTKKDMKTNSLYPVAIKLSEYLERNVIFSPDTRSDVLTNMTKYLKEKDVLLVENTRFEDLDNNKESKCDEELSKYWASLGDIYINDAYASSHRAHASTVGIPKYLPSGVGFLVEKEINKLDSILNSTRRPFVTIMGGKKVDDKIVLIEKMLEKCDKILIGGAMSFTFLKAAGYEMKGQLISEDYIDFAKDMLTKYEEKIILPVDFVVKNKDEILTKKITEFEDDDIGYDIGPLTINKFKKEIVTAKRIIMNGPMGLFEEKEFSKGTKKIMHILSQSKVKTLIGGGDTAAAANILGYDKSFYHISTGGGATLKYLESSSLVAIDAIQDKK